MITIKEFEESLLDPIGFWGGKTAAQVENLLGRDTARMVGFDQNNPHHCYDLFMHTLYTVKNLGDACIDIKIAAFFHDIGKPPCARSKQGRTVFYGHAEKSAQIAGKLLADLGYAKEKAEKICFWIDHHDDFISWILPEEGNPQNAYQIVITPENLARHIEKACRKDAYLKGANSSALWAQLLLLCRADASAQAETAVQDGKIVGTREMKVKKVDVLEKALAGVSFDA